MLRRRINKVFIIAFAVIYFTIELTFLVGNGVKITHGGWLTLLLAATIFLVMYAWFRARKIKNELVRFVNVEQYYQVIDELSKDSSVPTFASQLVYLTSANNKKEIEAKIIYSIINKKPKRADVYWFVHVDVTDTPYGREYSVEQLIPGKLIRIDFKLGFREEQSISLLFRKVVEDMVANKEVDIISQYNTLRKHKIAGDFNFVVLEKVFTKTSELNWQNRIIMEIYRILRRFSLSEEKGFGLDSSFVTLERVPLNIPNTEKIQMNRIH